MAHLQKCEYCSGQVINSLWHPECRTTKLEDLLFQVQMRLRDGFEIQKLLKQEILAETFRSKAEIEREHKGVEQRQFAKEHWKLAHAEAMRQADAKFTDEHPDPDPVTY